MNFKFVAQHGMLGLSECERLCGRSSRDIEDLALRSGWHGLPGSPISVSVGTALNMLVLSIAMNHGIEPQAMVASLPGLRDEALLELGTDVSNWSFEGSPEADKQFWPISSTALVMPSAHPETCRTFIYQPEAQQNGKWWTADIGRGL